MKYYLENLNEDYLNEIIDDEYFTHLVKLPSNHNLKNLKNTKKQSKIESKKSEN